jgi:hypothetical protein
VVEIGIFDRFRLVLHFLEIVGDGGAGWGVSIVSVVIFLSFFRLAVHR